MKLWHFAALIAVLGIAYVLIKRPAVTAVPVSTSASNAQGLLSFGTSLANLGSSLFSGGNKAAPPSTTPADTSIGLSTDTGKASSVGVDANNAATYVPGESLNTYSTSIFGPGTDG